MSGREILDAGRAAGVVRMTGRAGGLLQSREPLRGVAELKFLSWSFNTSPLCSAFLLCAAAVAAFASPSTYVFQGAFTTDNQIEMVGITVNASEQVTIRTYAYGGGAIGSTTASAGGFAPNAILFDSAGNEIAADAGGHCAVTSVDSTTGNCDDAFIQETLEPGTYTLALAEYDNQPNDSFLADGFKQSGNPNFTCAEFGGGSLCDVTTALGPQRSGNFILAVTADRATAITNVDGAIAYLVGDVSPYTADVAPGFGDGTLSIADLILELFAVNNLPGFQPVACSDRFDAMDLFPADTSSARGGDGVLDIRDLILELFRVNNLDISRPVRATRLGVCAFGGGSSSSSESLTDATRNGRFPVRPQGALALGSPRLLGANEEAVPIYLEAREDLVRVALTFALGDQRSQLRFVPSAAAPPSIVQDHQKGAVAAAWLSGVSVRAGERLLLGYVAGPPGAVRNLEVYGLSAAGLDDNRDVRLELSAAKPEVVPDENLRVQ